MQSETNPPEKTVPLLRAYSIEWDSAASDVLRVQFVKEVPADNDRLVRDASARLDEMTQAGLLPGGPLLKINGPASLPVALVLGHALSHRYGAIAVFDPKLSRYVVAIAHGPTYKIGDLIE